MSLICSNWVKSVSNQLFNNSCYSHNTYSYCWRQSNKGLCNEGNHIMQATSNQTTKYWKNSTLLLTSKFILVESCINQFLQHIHLLHMQTDCWPADWLMDRSIKWPIDWPVDHPHGLEPHLSNEYEICWHKTYIH